MRTAKMRHPQGLRRRSCLLKVHSGVCSTSQLRGTRAHAQVHHCGKHVLPVPGWGAQRMSGRRGAQGAMACRMLGAPPAGPDQESAIAGVLPTGR